MESKILERLESKITEASLRKTEIKHMAGVLDINNVSAYSILVGMLYNSFYYQTKRICSREPTNTESTEFVEWLVRKRSEIENALV